MSSLSEKMISEFVESTTPAKEKKSHEFTINGTVTSIDHNGVANVRLDGGAETPCQATVGCSTGDRVIVSFKNREPVVTSNISKPTATLEEVNAKVVNAVNVFAQNGTFSGSLSAATGTFSGIVRIHDADPYYPTGVEVEIGNTGSTGATIRVRTQWPSGETDPFYNVSVAPNGITVYSSEGGIMNSCWYASDGQHPPSDRRLKSNIVGLTGDIAKALLPVKYNFLNSNIDRYGFIAQDVQDYIPGAVREGRDGYLTLNYQEFIAPTLALAQENARRVEALEAEVKELRKEILRLNGET